MKLIVIKGNLKEGLGLIERASMESQNLPILRNVLIETNENRINLVATNLEIATTAFVAGKVIEPGKITVPLSLLKEIINNLQSEKLNIETKDGSLEIKTDNYQAVLQGVSAEDFPIVPQIKNTTVSFEIKGSILKESLNQVVVSAQANDLRPTLSSVLLDFALDTVKLAATDSHRLSEKNLREGQFKANETDPFKILLPLKTANEVLRITAEDDLVEIRRDENQVCFKTERFELISRLLEGDFPDYAAIVPKTFETELVLDKEELINAIKVVGVLSSKVNEIKIKIGENKKNIEIFSSDQGGENNCTVAAKVLGKTKEISFNWRYLLDGLKNIKTKDVFWGINEENKPALLKAQGDTTCFYVLMPILKA